MKKINYGLLLLVVFLFLITGCSNNVKEPADNKEPIKIGFIGAMTGPVAKYGSYEAVQLAVEDINAVGGIDGRPIILIAEDGKCDSKTAVDAMNKLVSVDGVKFILGGHCTPESVAIAPIAESSKVIMLASITTSPALTNMGDYVFRTSPVSVVQSVIVADIAYTDLNLRRMAVFYEQTDYARPIAEKMKDEFKGEVILYEAYTPGTSDFRTILTKAKNQNADSIFLSAQSPDAALNFMKQTKELGLDVKLFGNDVAGIPVNIEREPQLYEGFILALPDWDQQDSKTSALVEKYNSKYNTKELPYGVWTAESYDAVFILADGIEKNGYDVEKVKAYLYALKDFEGASGKISIDSNGDGVRIYTPKIVKDGKIVKYEK